MSEINYTRVLLLDDNENGLIPYILPATSNALGAVKPDDTTIHVDNAGTISADTFLAYSQLGAISGTVSLQCNIWYDCTIFGTTSFSLPTPTDFSIANQIAVTLYNSSAHSISLGTTTYWTTSVSTAVSSTYFTLIYAYNVLRSDWTVGILKEV